MANTELLKDDEVKRIVSKRLSDARMRMIFKTPFYGSLVLHLKFTLAACQTAATDMKRVMFDPDFVMRISDEELDFVLRHEIMHCVLQHCFRSKGKHHYFYNIASDIVVNSNIMQSLYINEFTIDGEKVMHLAPNGKEGFLYTADEVYDMLMDKHKALIRDVDEVLEEIENEYGVSIDSHDIWGAIPLDESLSAEWKNHLKEAAKMAGAESSYPMGAREFLDSLKYESRLNWREVLQNFIKVINDKYDYLFTPPDRRFSSTSDFILPSFESVSGEKVENIWFVVDSSGSISREELTIAYKEVKASLSQFDYLQGRLSFFDTTVTEPVSFDSIESLNEVIPEGGGGTSFAAIFSYMEFKMKDSLPSCVVILTDGFANFPEEKMAMGIPVLWIIAGSHIQPPWGTTVYLD